MAHQQGQVKIGREFFEKIKADYADWRWALVREFLQNCFDAPGSKNVVVEVSAAPAGTTLTVTNDGAPMDQDTLVNKLLTLGGSGKNFDGENTGGFGVAKSLLYYCHREFQIWTGDILVSGSGAQYTIDHQTKPLDGTRSTILLDGDEAEALLQNFKRFAHFAQWRGKLTLNGEAWNTDLHKGARRKDLGWGVVYTNNSFSNTCIVRLNGQPMFSCWTRFKGCVLIELTGKAIATLTSNRDGLRGSYASQLSDFLTSLAVDKRSALREQRAEYKRYQGELMRNEARKPKEAEQGLDQVVDVQELAAKVCAGPRSEAPPPTALGNGGITVVVETREDEADKTVSVGPQFILKNTTGKKAPARFTPGKSFCKPAKDLIGAWTGLLLKLHQLANVGGEFSVGFVFDDESEAESEKGVYGQVYYINPVKDGQAQFPSPWAKRHELMALAAHEVVHGVFGLGEHDEDYAGKLTDLMALVAANERDLASFCWPGDGVTGAEAPETDKDRLEELSQQYDSLVAQLERMEAELHNLKPA